MGADGFAASTNSAQARPPRGSAGTVNTVRRRGPDPVVPFAHRTVMAP